jgi:hypothetical protein
MKVISIWNPYALLLAHGHKTIETRGWPAPKSLIGQRIGIASTKIIRPDQRTAFEDEHFQEFYKQTGLFERLEDMPNGCLLATGLLHSCDMMTEEDLDDITEEEKIYGWFEPGRYAWRMRAVEKLANPLPVRGAQGVWELDDVFIRRAQIHLVD